MIPANLVETLAQQTSPFCWLLSAHYFDGIPIYRGSTYIEGRWKLIQLSSFEIIIVLAVVYFADLQVECSLTL